MAHLSVIARPRALERAAPAHRPPIDYDVHGFVRIRLIGASDADAAAAARQLGPLRASTPGEPDITIRFVERLPAPAAMQYLGLNEFGFAADGFYVLRGRHKSRVRVRLPFEQVGGRCQIVCQRGASAIPYLISVINLTALVKGFVPLHASAFEYNGRGVLVTGWSKGGKTETLLAFAARGARYIGDEWVYLSADGNHMYGLPEPVRVWDWHLRYWPHARRIAGRQARIRLRALEWLHRLYTALPPAAWSAWPPLRLLGRLMPLLERQRYVDLPPQRLFGGLSEPLRGKVDVVLFASSHEAADITVDRIDPLQVARRMAYSLRYEQLDFMGAYLAYRFAFPDRANFHLARLEARQTEMLFAALAGKEAYALGHPYPVALPELFEAVRPLVS